MVRITTSINFWGENFDPTRVEQDTGLLYTSKMEAVDAIFELVIKGLKDYRISHGAYTVMDFRIAKKWKAFNMNLILKNLLNEEYTTRPAISESPRNLTFKIDYNF